MNTQKRLDSLKSQFREVFYSTAQHYNRYEVFSDFIFCIAAAYRNSIKFTESTEFEYLQIIKKYSRSDVEKLTELFGLLILISDVCPPKDHLGELYMEFNLFNYHRGQHFTPSQVSLMMARMLMPDLKQKIAMNNFVSISDPACGAGSTLLACIAHALNCNINPQKQFFIEGRDIDRLAALMCYVQLCIWHIPSRIIVGDTLKNEVIESWYTPSYYLGAWQWRLNDEPKKIPVQEPNQINFVLVGDTYT
ncbi:TPA: N-6 DNA methylase [Acinetobacter baumannii]|uniref:N-6 DNA methylase n=2 Tax=Acinetobacter baumannii TaxID=470 RepID=UPI00028339AB|nr:N-6 DNA methylase [Acinetobacter baumannii]EHU3033156.1 N-6 DNA methylase [Acinetobacter baumannii]EIB7144062.1 N-6 DNA methylase [Acinetobacter baumannii]EKA71911.1 N-6 DNA Methylase domain protein [Acinetobacter baumannii IS-58]EKK06246.1 N-6 DNA Methylase domain protein [Acinetobacter baumannii IS-235]EKU0974918.1 N-6 DNA methylase [Acinetobacter baumannii]